MSSKDDTAKEIANWTITITTEAKNGFTAHFGGAAGKAYVRTMGPATGVVIGSVDVIHAFRNGSNNQVLIESAGLAGGLASGALLGAGLGALAGSFVPGAGNLVGGIVGGVFGSIYGEKGVEWLAAKLIGEDAVGSEGSQVPIVPERIQVPPINLPVTPNNGQVVVRSNSDGSETHSHTDPNSGVTVATRVHVDPSSGSRVGVYSTVIDPTSPLRGMTYPVTAVQNGYELNALDRISEESHARALVKKAQEEAAAIARAKAERDRRDGGPSSSSSSSSSTTQTGSVPQPPRPGDGGASGGFTYHDSTYGTGNATRGRTEDRRTINGHPIVIDLDDDGVEISPLGGSTARFDYDNDGFKELTAWVGKDDGLLVYDIGNDGLITETREVVIAEWTADTTDTDLDALKAVFDTNNDGVLNDADTGWANFKIWNDADQASVWSVLARITTKTAHHAQIAA